MKKFVLSLVAMAALGAPALAADMKVKAPPPPPPPASPWTLAFGSALMSDYIFRGITQSAHQPSVAAYFEPRYTINDNWQLYAGVSGESIAFPNRAAAEIDFYGGVRPTFGKFAFDFGAWYYYYPGGQCFNATVPSCFGNGIPFPQNLPNGNAIKNDLSFWEVYGKLNITVTDEFTVGGSVWYSPSVLNSGANGTFAAATAKYVVPSAALPFGIGVYFSGDYGYWWLGTSDSFYCTQNGITCVAPFPRGIPYTSYATWDLGIGFTYKVLTLDLRYYDTNLNKGDCNAFTSDHTATGVFNTAINPGGPASNWCGARFVAKLSADLDFAKDLK